MLDAGAGYSAEPSWPTMAARIIATHSSSEIEPLLSTRCASIHTCDTRRMRRVSLLVANLA